MTRTSFNADQQRLPVVVVLLLAATAALAESAGPEPRPADRILEEVVVKGQLLDGTRGAFSVTHFSPEALRKLELTQLQDVLTYVPGMSIRRFGLSGVADSITIRGFGEGGHGGDLGVVLDGIPLNEAMSHADGYVDLNVIVPLEIESLTVFKGPVSALYGNFNRGGLLKLDTRSSGDYAQLDVSAGSHELLDLQGVYGRGLGSSQQINLAAQHHRSNGFRPQSDTERTTLSGAWRVDVAARTDLALSGRWHTADSDNPSYLTEDQYRADPYGIDPNVQNDGAEKDFGTLRLDLNHVVSESAKLLSFVYGTRQDLSRWFSRPTGASWEQREESYDREVLGAGVSLNMQHQPWNVDLSWIVGIEGFREDTHYEYYDELDNRRRQGSVIADRGTELSSASAFAELQAQLHPLFTPSLGVRYDRFDGECRLKGPETGASPCESLNDLDHLSPKIGFRSALRPGVTLRASWAEGFALPGGWVKYQSQAENLDAVSYQQAELAATFDPTERLRLDLAVYELDSSGEVRTIAPGIFENFGRTERRGVEVTLDWTPIDTLTLSGVYNAVATEISRNPDPGLKGNEVAGVSDNSITVRATWEFLPALHLDFDWRSVDGFALDAANTLYSDDYEVTNVGVAYTGWKGWRVYTQVDNLTDEVYAPSQFIIGGGPVYGTGAPRQFRLGVQLSL